MSKWDLHKGSVDIAKLSPLKRMRLASDSRWTGGRHKTVRRERYHRDLHAQPPAVPAYGERRLALNGLNVTWSLHGGAIQQS
jgi:hypothetical protein